MAHRRTRKQVNLALVAGRRAHHRRETVVRRIKQLIWGSKKRRVAATLSAFALIAASAFAFYIILVGATGSGTGTLGTTNPAGTQKVQLTLVTLPPDLTPGQSGSVMASVTNPNGYQVNVDPTYLQNNSAFSGSCNPAWLQYTAPVAPIVVPANATVPAVDIGTMKFLDTGADQGSCSGASITLTFH